MIALPVGPVVLPWGPVIILAGYGLATLIAWSNRRRGQADAEPALYSLLLLALAGARMGFVATHWQEFDGPWAMLDIRDAGFAFWPGVSAALAGGLLWIWRRPALGRPLVTSLAGGTLAAALLASFVAPRQVPRKSLPHLTLQTIDGATVQLSGMRGKPLVMNLWATWCPPCQRELPMLVKAATRTPGIRFILVDQGQDAPTVRAYLNRKRLDSSRIVLDPDGLLLRAYHAPGLPTTLFVDAQGELKSVRVGQLSRATLAEGMATIRRRTPASTTNVGGH